MKTEDRLSGTVIAAFNHMCEQRISKGQNGFSLVEVLIVMGIIAVIAIVVSPFFGGFMDNRALKTATRDLTGDIFELRERAINENRWYRITFSVGGNSYTLAQCNNANTGGTCSGGYTTFATKSPAAFRSGVRLSGVSFGTTLQLSPRGLAVPVNAGIVTLRNNMTVPSVATITINATGRPRVDWNLN
jgi:prepilin-type N-terminal cleavage/methylation domain-containing protein